MAQAPDIKALNSQLIDAVLHRDALASWLQEAQALPRPSADDIMTLDKKFGASLPDDVVMYLRLNNIPWVCSRARYRAMSGAALLADDKLKGPVLPLCKDNDDHAGVGIDLRVPSGQAGHVVWFENIYDPQATVSPVKWDSWAGFYVYLIAQCREGEVLEDQWDGPSVAMDFYQ